MIEADHPNPELINGIFALFLDNIQCHQNWGFFMFSPEFRREHQLRNKIGCIWITSLLDSLDAERRVLAQYNEEAASVGAKHLQKMCDQASLFFDAVADVLRLYTKDEQLFLADFRDVLVHSWLARRHHASFRKKYFDGHKIVSEAFTQAEFAEAVTPFYESGIDDSLSELVARFQDRTLRYWHVYVDFKRLSLLDRMYPAMFRGRATEIPSLNREPEGEATFTFG